MDYLSWRQKFGVTTPSTNSVVIVQFGANLPMARLAGEAERWLGKPVISINVVTCWAALRAVGIDDRIYGFTQLLSRF